MAKAKSPKIGEAEAKAGAHQHAAINAGKHAALPTAGIGDKVLVEMTPYDLTKGRITYRFK